MTNAYQHELSDKTAESNDEPVRGEMPNTGQQSLFTAAPEADRRDLFAQIPDQSRPPSEGETQDPGQEELSGVRSGSEPSDYLAKLREEHRDYLARLEANRHDHAGEAIEESIEPSGELPVAAPAPASASKESFGAIEDRASHAPLGETAEESPQPVAGEAPSASSEDFSGVTLGAGQLEYLAQLEAEHQARLAQLEADRQKSLDEAAEQKPQPAVSEMPAANPVESFFAGLDAVPQEPVGETVAESAQPAVNEMPAANPVESFFAGLDAVPQEPVGETVAENAQPAVNEMPAVSPVERTFAEPDAVPQEPVGETVAENTQPAVSEMPFASPVERIFAAPDAVQQERPDMSLGAEQLDYLSKLEAQHQEYLARLEADRQLSADAAANQPESMAIPPSPSAELPPVDFSAPDQPVPPIDILSPIAQVAPAEPARPAWNAAVTIVVIGIVLGVVFGGVIAAMTWNATKPAATPAPAAAAADPNISRDLRDLGSVDSSAVGLSGHLTAKWDGRLNYTVVIAPDDPSRQAAFALMVSDPPRPLSMNIELKNTYGFILCSQEAVLKYDAGNAAAEGKAQADTAAPLAVDEAAREKDKDVFQNQIGADGKLASISAQGQIPCPAQAYANFAYWSFTPNYPDIGEQDQLLQAKLDAAAAAKPVHAVRKLAKTAKTH